MKEGLGPRVNTDSSGDINVNRALGAGVADSCAVCHGRPKGSAGFGGDVATQPDSRDAPHLFGLGIVEQLAEKLNQELRQQRDRAQQIIREFVIGVLKDEMGMQAWDPVLCAVTDSAKPQAVRSPSGFSYDPLEDSFERPPVYNSLADKDADGVVSEFDPASIDHLEFYLLNYFKPAQYQTSFLTRSGQRIIDDIGCTSCHVSELTIDSDRRVADVETNYDAKKGIFNNLLAVASTRFGEPIVDNDAYPVLPVSGDSFTTKHFFLILSVMSWVRHSTSANTMEVLLRIS